MSKVHLIVLQGVIARIVSPPHLLIDLFEERRRLMEQWATFCTTPAAQETPGNVAPMRRMG